MSKFRIYTSGAMKYVPVQIANKWRYRIAEYFWREDADASVFVPSEYFGYEEKRHKTESQVMDYFLNEVAHSDLMILNLDNSDMSVGTGMEVCHAHDNNIPIIGYKETGEGIDSWCEDMCTVVFDDMEEMLEYIKVYYVFRGKS